MDTTWSLHVGAITFLFMLAIGGTGVEGIRCNFCLKLNKNEDCNANVAECTNQNHDACYTSVTWIDSTTKYYNKGCHNYNECHKLETDREKCDKVVMNCTYCCRDRSTCNAYNAATTTHARLAALPLSWLLPLLTVSLHKFLALYGCR